MAVRGYRVQSSPAALVWAGGILLLALLSLGLVDHQSARQSRAQLAAVPTRPLVLVDLRANREARERDVHAELDAWREAASSLGMPVEVFDGESLRELDPSRYSVWILPGQERLSEGDWAALDAYLAGSGGLIATGFAGRRSESGGRVDQPVLARLFPGESFARSGAGQTRLTVVGRSPLVAGLAPGDEIALATRARALSSASAGSLELGDTRSRSVALVGRHRNARIAWLGFSLGALADAQKAQRIATNALLFASRAPLLELRPWPDGRPCAVLVDGGGPVDQPGDRCRVDADRVEEPELLRLTRSGCRVATTAAGARVIPDVLAHSGGTLVSIPEPRPRLDAEGAALLRDLLSGYERAERMGSVFSLRAKAEWRQAKGRQALLDSVGQELGSRGAWFAHPAELADWWLAREQVEARLEPVSADTVRVVFANRGRAIARGVTARVDVPGGAVSPRVEPGRVFARRALLRLASDHSWVELVARPLDPGTEVSYTLRF